MKWDWSKPYPSRTLAGGMSLAKAVIELYEECGADQYVCSVSAFRAAGIQGTSYAVPVMAATGMQRLYVQPDAYCPPFQVWPLILTEEEKLRKRVHELEHALQSISDSAKRAANHE